jgi:hypothetical protein
VLSQYRSTLSDCYRLRLGLVDSDGSGAWGHQLLSLISGVQITPDFERRALTVTLEFELLQEPSAWRDKDVFFDKMISLKTPKQLACVQMPLNIALVDAIPVSPITKVTGVKWQ